MSGGAKICTRACTGEYGAAGCPIGYDCGVTDPALGLTCNKTPYSVDPTTGAPLLFGKNCSLDGNACSGTGDPNASPSCRKAPDRSMTPVVPVATDPNAYCTGACSSAADCPSDFECLSDYDGAQKCLRRDLCSECTHNGNCPSMFPHCVPTRDGSARYCTKSCTGFGQCGGFQGTFLECAGSTDSDGTAASYCLHRYGACVGAGEICDPCRQKADCAKISGSCINNELTGERFCSKQCSSDSACAGPNNATCDNTIPGETYQVCTGDPDHLFPGTLTCWH